MNLANNYSNIPSSIKNKIGRQLHNQKNHPIEIMKNKIYKYFDNMEKFDNLEPFVDVKDNFDKLLIPPDHPARSKSDTYYVNENTVLRTHTSAHQNQLLSNGHRNFLVTGDVYRKDEINETHHPIFHQMEGLGEIPNGNNPEEYLHNLLGNFVQYLFPEVKYKINNDYFPFTDPSFEVEIYHNDKWIEILGSGIVHKQILENNKIEGNFWAFGLGLERLCMIYYSIPDIRYFWSIDNKFLNQFNESTIKFKPYSQLSDIFRDISFWIPETQIVKKENKIVWLMENDFNEFVMNYCGDVIKKVEFKDEYYNSKTKKYSRMYRIVYNADTLLSITNPSELKQTVDTMHKKINTNINDLGLIIR